jgi:hypothetical protein
MDDSNRFFKFVWRFNALIVAAAGLLAILLALYALYEITKSVTQDRDINNVVTIDPAVPVEEDIYLGYPQIQNGAGHVRVALYRDQRRSMGLYSKSSGGNMVNVLFVDAATGAQSWLFKGTQRQIFSDLETFSSLRSSDRVVAAIVYTLAEADSNGDGRISNEDQKSIAVSLPDGSGYRVVLADVERLFSVEQISDNRVLVLYAKGAESRSAIFNVPDFSLVKDSAIPLVAAQ